MGIYPSHFKSRFNRINAVADNEELDDQEMVEQDYCEDNIQQYNPTTNYMIDNNTMTLSQVLTTAFNLTTHNLFTPEQLN